MKSDLQIASSRNSHSGFSLFELIVAIIIIALLATTLLNRMQYYQEQAEKTAMVEVAAAIQTALILQYGRLLMHGRDAEIPELAVENPMDWLLKKPQNYAGEFYAPTPATVKHGNWVFDLKSRELIYVPLSAAYVSPGKDGYKWIRYRAWLKNEPPYNAGGAMNEQGYSGVLFEQVEPNLWSS